MANLIKNERKLLSLSNVKSFSLKLNPVHSGKAFRRVLFLLSHPTAKSTGAKCKIKTVLDHKEKSTIDIEFSNGNRVSICDNNETVTQIKQLELRHFNVRKN